MHDCVVLLFTYSLHVIVSMFYYMFYYTVTASNVTCHVYHYTLYVEEYQVINSTIIMILYSTFPLALYVSTCAVTFDTLHPVKQLPRDATGHALYIASQ